MGNDFSLKLNKLDSLMGFSGKRPAACQWTVIGWLS